MMNNLVIISSQFQLINSIELIKKEFNNQDFNAVVFIHNNNHLYQIESLAKKNNIKILFKVRYRKILQYFFLILKSLFIQKFDKVIIGNCHDNLMQFMLKTLRYNHLYFVDDGNILETLNIKPKINNRFLPVKYFTLFNVDNNKYYDFIYNDYNHIKKSLNIEQVKDNTKIIFIGQPLVEQGLIEKEIFINIFNKIIKRLDRKLLYVLHPRELENKFLELKNISTIRLDKGIESYLISSNMLPSKVIGFYSTALNSISKIFSSDEIDIRFVDLSRHTKIIHGQSEYKYLKENLNEIII